MTEMSYTLHLGPFIHVVSSVLQLVPVIYIVYVLHLDLAVTCVSYVMHLDPVIYICYVLHLGPMIY